MSTEDAAAAYVTGYAHLRYNKYYIMASCIVNLYDHLITLDSEIEHVWRSKQKWRLPTYCFFVFRYIPPVISIVNFFADHDPRFRGSICQNWIWLPVFNAPLVSMSTGVILVLRVWVIYNKALWVIILLVPLYLAEIGVMLWSVPAGAPAQLPPGWVGCVPSKKPGTGNRLSAMFVAALAFDTVLFALTIARGIFFRATRSKIGIGKLIIRDGTVYFFIIFIVNLANVLLLTIAPEDLSAINTPFSSLIAATMVSRLVFNLRETAQRQMNLSTLSANSSTSTRRYETMAFARGEHTSAQSTGTQFLGLEELEVDLHGEAKVEERDTHFDVGIELQALRTHQGA